MTLTDTLDDLAIWNYKHRQYLSASTRLMNQIKRIKRDFGKDSPLVLDLKVALKVLMRPRRAAERELARLAAQLPVFDWAMSHKGFGAVNLARLCAELGDPGNYSCPSKMWMRMCVGVIDGRAQRRVRGSDALKQRYNPKRRAVMHIIGDCLIRQRSPHYYALYLTRKDYEAQRNDDGDYADQAAARLAIMVRVGAANHTKTAAYKAYRADKLSAGDLHKRAHRYMEKRVLRDFWLEWHRPATQDMAIAA